MPEDVPKVESNAGPVLSVGVPPFLIVQSILSLVWLVQVGVVPEIVQLAEHCSPSNAQVDRDSKFSKLGKVVTEPEQGQSLAACATSKGKKHKKKNKHDRIMSVQHRSDCLVALAFSAFAVLKREPITTTSGVL